MAGTGWRASLVRLSLCAGFLCVAWMLLGAGQARAEGAPGTHHRVASHAAKSLPVKGVSREVKDSVSRPIVKPATVVREAKSPVATARAVVRLVRDGASPQGPVVRMLTGAVSAVVGVRPGVDLPGLVPLHPSLALVRTSSPRPQILGATPVRPGGARGAARTVVTVQAGVTGGPRGGGMATLGLPRLTPAAALANDPNVPPLSPSPWSPGPSVLRWLETTSGATDFAALSTTLGAAEPQSVRYAGVLTVPGGSAVKGPDQRPD